jgi:uncharacterized protein YjbI with pentapeptide repeats
VPNPDHITVLRRGVDEWNRWRRAHRDVIPDLSNASLPGLELAKANLAGADLSGSTLRRVYALSVNLRYANLNRAKLVQAYLRAADLTGAQLIEAQLIGASFYKANLSGADMTNADLSYSVFVETRLDNAVLRGCKVYGASAWSISLDGTDQSDLRIGGRHEAEITVDNLEVAQFVHLLLNSRKIRNVVDTVTSKLVLILGRFTADRKTILDSVRRELRILGYVPVLVDFEGPESRDITETVVTLAHMARFIIADLTDARSVPQELASVVPFLPSVPVQPLLCAGHAEFVTFDHFRRYPWVLEPAVYADEADLLRRLKESVIDPADRLARQQIDARR